MLDCEALRTDADKVEAWRLDQLLRAGYPLYLAELLGRRGDIDLREACALLKAGCPPELAGRILL